MSLSFFSCSCGSTTRSNSVGYTSYNPTTSEKEVQHTKSRDGYIITHETVRNNDIRPVKTVLYPKLKMSEKDLKLKMGEKDYAAYTIMMRNLECLPKKVSFADEHDAAVSARENQHRPGPFPVCPASELLSSDSDYVSLEEYEPCRLQRLNRLPVPAEENILQTSYDNVLTATPNASTNQHSFYDRPGKPITTNYDLPRKKFISAHYDILKRNALSTDYDIPNKSPVSTDYDIPNKNPVSADYDIPNKTPVSAEYDIPNKSPVSTDYDIPRKRTLL